MYREVTKFNSSHVTLTIPTEIFIFHKNRFRHSITCQISSP